MDERVEAPEGEGGGTLPGGADVSTALSMQARRKRSAKGDPLFDAYLSQQTRLAELQAEHLHEQRELVLSRLRWGRFGDRMRSLLQVMTVLVGVAVALVIGAMAWQAHEAHGLVIEAFSVPPELARSGLTGQVAAGRFLDKLQGMQAVTANSDRPAQSYESNWGSDFKVEIPDTGLTFSEIEKLMRERLGHVSHVSGEVLAAPDGAIAVTARMGDAPPQTFTGPAASFDALAQKAAEAVYGESQPYRYAEYLDTTGRVDEATAVISDLARHGPQSERGWAYAKWASIDLNDRGDTASAQRHAARSMGYGGGSDVNGVISQLNAHIWSGHEEQNLQLSRALDVMVQKRQPDTSEDFFTSNKLLAHAWLQFVSSDYLASGKTWSGMSGAEGTASFDLLSQRVSAMSYALGHDLPAARRAMAKASDATPDQLAWQIAQGAFLALPAYWMDAETDRWADALAEARAMDATLEAGKAKRPIYGPMQQVWVWPLEATALAHLGDIAGAQAVADRTPLDCYPCVRARAAVAVAAHDAPTADRWFTEAVRQGPSLPQAYVAWARARLDRGDADGAIALMRQAQPKAPRMADVPQIWGEALAAKGDFGGAAEKYAQAQTLAPAWGRARLKHGAALALLGRREAADKDLQQASVMDLTGPERTELVSIRR